LFLITLVAFVELISYHGKNEIFPQTVCNTFAEPNDPFPACNV
jgi:hypothetical protein